MNRRRTFSKKKLYKENAHLFFTEVVEVGRTYQYYDEHYLFRHVEKAAKKYGIKIKYNNSSDFKYDMYGSFNFTVVSIDYPPKKQLYPQLFDINELAL